MVCTMENRHDDRTGACFAKFHRDRYFLGGLTSSKNPYILHLSLKNTFMEVAVDGINHHSDMTKNRFNIRQLSQLRYMNGIGSFWKTRCRENPNIPDRRKRHYEQYCVINGRSGLQLPSGRIDLAFRLAQHKALMGRDAKLTGKVTMNGHYERNR